MFNFVRNHTKIIMGVLVLLVFPSFVLFGIGNYSLSDLGAVKVARVDGHGITQAEWDSAVRNEADRIRRENPTMNIKLLDTPAFKYGVLNSLVRERVLAAAATHQRLTISDAQLTRALEQAFNLRKPDGSLDTERYQQVATAQGLSPAGLDALMRAQLQQRQVLGGVAQASLVNQALADTAAAAQQQQRQARIALFKPADYQAKLNPADADLQAFYQSHITRYQAPESAKIEYVVFDLDSIKHGVAVNESDLRTYYQQNAATLGKPEQRRASHILIAAPKDAPDGDRAKAKAHAEELLAQLRKAPDTFAAVAKANSQDDTSAKQGGDLNWFQRDKGMVPALSQAAFGLSKTGELSGVVESDYGYHIVRLTGIEPASVPPFEQARADLEDKFRTQQAQRRFGELADTFTNTVYEQSDSLKPAADPLKLPIQTAEVTRPPAPGARSMLAHPKFLEAIFSADAREKKRNTQAIETGPNQLTAGRVTAYSPAHARPYAEVKDQVRAAYLAERGAQLARQAGEQQLKAWQANPASVTGLSEPLALSRQDPQKQPAALVEAVLRAAPAKLPALIGVDLGAQGYAIAQVEKILPWSAPDKKQAERDLDAYQQLWNQAEEAAYYSYLKDRHKAQILAPQPTGPAVLMSEP